MSHSQKRAVANYRRRLGVRGLARFDVLGRNADRDLIRSLARKLAEDTPQATELRALVSRSIGGGPPKKGGVVAALLASPLVDSGINLSRPHEEGRQIEL